MRFLFIIFLFICGVLRISAAKEITVVPLPQQVELHDGIFVFSSESSIRLYFADSSHVMLGIYQLQQEIKAKTGLDIVYIEQDDAVIHIGMPADNQALADICQKENIWPQEKTGAQGYVLLIKENMIVLAANSKQGIFYAIQTLKQLIRGSSTSNSAPCVKIIDWPELNYRGMQDDISRGPVPTMEFMKAQVRRCAELKLNLLSYYIEHVVKTDKYADFAPADGPLGQGGEKVGNAVYKLVAYCPELIGAHFQGGVTISVD